MLSPLLDLFNDFWLLYGKSFSIRLGTGRSDSVEICASSETLLDWTVFCLSFKTSGSSYLDTTSSFCVVKLEFSILSCKLFTDKFRCLSEKKRSCVWIVPICQINERTKEVLTSTYLYVLVHPNLDLVNEPVRPLLFTKYIIYEEGSCSLFTKSRFGCTFIIVIWYWKLFLYLKLL